MECLGFGYVSYNLQQILDQVMNITDNIFIFPVINSHPCMVGNGGCEHICIPKVNKQRTCRCTTGYKADGEKGCKPYDKFAIVSQLDIVRGFSLDGAGEAMAPIAEPGQFIREQTVELMKITSMNRLFSNRLFKIH